jgi:hypothetical protein
MRKSKVFCAVLATTVVVGLAPSSSLAASVEACASGAAQCTTPTANPTCVGTSDITTLQQ